MGWKPLLCKWIRNILEHFCTGSCTMGCFLQGNQEALSQGKLVVASMGPGTFTRGGHFIVLTGITDDGKIKVNDPNDNSSKQHINQAFAVSLILRESKAMWVFE